RIFFGMDLQCAQCHDHPLVDDYYQTDYFGLFSFFNRSYIFTNKKKVAFAADRPDGDVEFKSVFTDETNLFSPQVPGELPVADPLVKPGDEYSVKPAADVRPVPKYSRRLELAKLVRQGGIPAFDRNIVNRLWAQLMGRGLVHPVDLHHTSNPPVQPELLDMLAKQFRDSKYDLKTFYRELALSQTYQRAFEFPEKMAADAEMAAQLAALQAAKAEKDKAVAALDEQFTTNRDALLKQRVTMLPVRAERDKAKSALATVNKAVAAATKAATDAKAKFDAKNAVAAAVADALQKSTEAAKKAPEDKVLAEAVAKISGRSTAFNKEAAPLKAAWEAADAKAKKAAEPVAAAAAKVTEQFTKLADLEKAALPLHQKYEDVVERRRLEALAANHLAERITNLQQLIDYRKLDQQSSATNAQLAAADKELAAAQAAVAALEPVAAENAEKLADAKASQAKLTPLAAELRKSATALLEQRDKAYDDLSQKLSDRFVTATLKPLNPEQLAWSLLQVGGLIERQRAASAAEINKKTPLDENAQKDPAKVAAREREIDAAAHVKLLGNVAPIVKLFGASAGQPQDEFFATVDQALFFSNGGQVRGWLNPSGDNLTARLGKLEDPSKVAEELYLGVLTRFPTKEEVADVTAYLSTEGLPKPAAVREMTWALVTSAEFRFNH
ncbi:MAG: DUF1553 domain-containing protein, partial [Pirellulaceae bacterium]|nr:DUF1553 domain-containing protein [Pirellulaceae bacterium]